MKTLRSLVCAALVALATPAFSQSLGLTQTISVQDSGTTCNVANTCAVFPTNSASSLAFQITGTWSGTLTFQASSDGVNYVAFLVANATSGSLATTTTSTGVFTAPNRGFQVVRVVGTTLASGSASVSGIRGYAMGGTDGLSPGGDYVAQSMRLGTSDGTTPALVLRSGTNLQMAHIYRTYTDASNYERLSLDWGSGTVARLAMEAAGTGSARTLAISGASLDFRINDSSKWQMDASGNFIDSTDNLRDIGASGATRPRSVYIGTSVVAPVYAMGAAAGVTLISSTAPTISSAFGTSPSVPNSNGTASFTVNVGTGGVATSGVIALPAAATGWNCSCNDVTTASATVFLCKQTASTTTTATIGNFNTSGAAAAWVASDILRLSCFAY